ncbi:MAG TPA: lytic transglycosylase domain-containing protein [Candidatus Angelobacter sp.]|nr:lytic transglycosylase domain-containing protein [Candidatus Angelobacter sp.]
MLSRRWVVFALAIMGAVGFAANKSSAAALSASDRAIYQSAFIAVEDDKWPVAEALADKAKDPLLAKVILWLDLMRFGSGHDFSDYADFIAENPDWPGQNSLQTQAELAMPPDLPAKKVLAFFGQREPNTFAGTVQLARALQASGDKTQAAAVVRRGWVELDGGEDDEKQFLAKYGTMLKAEDHIARLDRVLWDGKQDATKRMMNRVDAAHRALAEARIALRNEKKNADKLVAKVPKSLQRDAGLIYERARWRRRKENYAAIPDLFFPPLQAVARPDMMWRELDDAARRALARGQVKVAYKLAIQHGADDGTTFAEGEWLSGWIALRFLHEPKTAYTHFTRLHGGVGSPISKARAAYWAGRAAEDLKKKEDAKSWYAEAAQWPTTYYGQLAAQRSGQRGPLQFAAVPEPTGQQAAAFAKLELVQVVQALREIDQADRARAFLLRLVDLAKTPTEHRLTAELAASLGRDDLMVATAKASRLQGIEMVDQLYPMVSVPPGDNPEAALTLAIIRQESAFQPDAFSSAGALGLMQLMPATAKSVATRIGLPYSKPRLTADPAYNISLGRAYLDQLIENYGGSYVLAIAGYNAGPGRVAEWISQNRDPRIKSVDAIDWVESIPLSETRNYVQRVLENVQVYRSRIGGTQIALSIEQDLKR